MAEDARDEKAIFVAALEKTTPQEREAFVEGACAGDAELLQRVRELLAAHDESVGPLDSPPPGLEATIDQPIAERPGTTVGPYKLLQELGEGGMGVVYTAEQSEPVQRRVALKIIKPGMDTRQVIARFEAEEQALAMMDHPNIAKVLDAGTTESGQPYFVMELVKGIPITKYCDEQHLTPRERLELFMPVCQAVQHAQQKGIIHRDIKPSNVLVALYDDKPVPKVIDFGVAKATSQKLTERTMFTHYGQIVGTLEYMSPEQAQLNQLDIDTRSDIYSLGVLLYELLTGDTPFDRQRLRLAAWDEMLRIIREEEPPKPSTKLSTIDTLPSVAANRKTEPKKLSALVRGELDWIVMKALEKDRARRYETATGLANDIQRYLNDEAVVACPPSAAYRFRKFARRNKAAIGAASLIALALIVGLLGTSWQAVRAKRAERTAQKNFEEEQKARQQAIDQRDRAIRAERSERQARDRARNAEREAKRELFNAYVAQAKASRWSGRPGQRLDALHAIKQAVKLIEPLELGEESRLALRNEAIGAMTLVDLEAVRRQRGKSCSNGYVTVSADGQLVAVDAGIDDYIRIQRVDNRAVDIARILPTDTSDYSHYLLLDPAARYLLRGTAISTTWYLSDLSTGQDTFSVSNVQQAAATDFHPQDQELAVGDMEGIVRFFELPSGNELRRFSFGHAVSVVKFSPDGRRLAVSGMEGPVQIHDAKTGAVRFQRPLGASLLAWRWDGTWLAAAAGSEIHLLEIREQGAAHIVCRGHSSLVINLQFHPENRLLASASWDATSRLWEAGSGHQLLRLEGGCQGFVSEGRLLAGSQGLDLVFWEVSTTEAYRWLHKGKTAATAVAPGGRLVVSCHDDGVRLWDVEQERVTGHLPIGPTLDVAFHPVDGSLVTSGPAGLYRWPVTVESGVSFERFRLGPAEAMETGLTGTRMLEFSRDGRALVVEGSYQDEAVVLHLDATPARKVRLTSPRLVNAALSPDGRWAAASCEVGMNVTIWNASTGEQVCQLPTTSSAQIRFSPDSRWVVTNTGPAIGIWDVGSWKPVHEIPGTADYCSGIAFTSDSRLVAVGLYGVGIRLIEVERGEPIATLEAVQKPPIYSNLEFSSDNTRLAAAVDHDGFCVWDVRAIRRRLADLGLDWDQPPLPKDEPTEWKLPLRVEVDLGVLEKKE